jgi:hypothetical protein
LEVHVRGVLVIVGMVGMVLALLLAAGPADASRAEPADQTVVISAVDSASAVVSAPAGHCHHVPCSDTSHNHASGGCAGHTFLPMLAFSPPLVFDTATRVAFANDVASGRALLPPVPPPLS